MDGGRQEGPEADNGFCVSSFQGFFIFIFHVVKSDKVCMSCINVTHGVLQLTVYFWHMQVWKNPRAMRYRSMVSHKFKSSSDTDARVLQHSSNSRS